MTIVRNNLYSAWRNKNTILNCDICDIRLDVRGDAPAVVVRGDAPAVIVRCGSITSNNTVEGYQE